MNFESYLSYVAAFNSQDWKRVHTEFYTPDVVIDFPVARFDNAADSLTWFEKAHESIFETLIVRTFRTDGHTLVVDLDVHFILLADTPMSPKGPEGRAGDNFEVPMLAVYDIAPDGRIARLTVTFEA
ncbi:SnoaL-like domain-containing protein [Amycolatopsis xylanica]|uniref:SnoaL-like domain-containing protein n=1 Tax=Amycolatopsis xylanica TaxID=589385 RepID=A0A1H3NQN6_9PSEU|nr:nuclear transport factor 2 family protein [Amycolatopsis xylanica]SDY91227.1 SnoaL-like domain-containing protein [Amycolatopsis xylanica]